MAKGKNRRNREAKKPKSKRVAAKPSDFLLLNKNAAAPAQPKKKG